MERVLYVDRKYVTRIHATHYSHDGCLLVYVYKEQV